MVGVYMTAKGGVDVTKAVSESSARLGVESSHDWIDGYTPKFVDFPFTNPDADFSDHLSVVRETRPDLTVAPDIEKGREVSEVIDKADELNQYARTVVIVPKSTRPSAVPDRFRVGFASPSFGSAASWNVWEYRDCGPVHILGGSPNYQIRVGKHLPVASVDTATLGQRCRFGMWDEKCIHAPDEWDYRKRLKESLNNYVNAWERLE